MSEPRVSNLINSGFVQEQLRTMLGLQGGDPIPGVAEELQPVLVMDDARAPEWGAAANMRRVFHAQVLAAGAAGTFNQVNLQVGADVGVLAIVERIYVDTGAAGGGFRFGRAPTTDADGFAQLGSSPLNLDSRFTGLPSWRLGSRTSAVILPGAQLFVFPARQPGLFEQLVGIGWVHHSNFSNSVGSERLYITNDVAVQPLTVAVIWRERPLNKGLRG